MHRGFDLPSRRLVSQEDASVIESANVPRSKFINRWTRKTAFDPGYLVPFLVEEILPGDHMKYNVTVMARMATPLFPMLDNQRFDTFFFFVPNRLLWENWARFMGEQPDPSSTIAFELPRVATVVGGDAVGSLYDHMGIPTIGQLDPAQALILNALPFRAYNAIYNQWFRDENIINSAVTNFDGGPDSNSDYTLRKRAKSHDYFTSALPWPQKFTAPTVPLAGLAPLQGIGLETAGAFIGATSFYETARNPGALTNYPGSQATGAAAPNRIVAEVDSVTGFPKMYADLSQATGVHINTLRQAWMIQSLLERDARGGTRYVELIWSHFRVRNPDFRLQRPEYIGGGQTPIHITPVAQTAPTAGATLGALGGTGTAAGQHRASYAATEHGYIIGIANIKSEISYQQGIHKMFRRFVRYDFYFPSFAGLGEQAIATEEIYATGVPANDSLLFGYQERYHELRTRYNEVTGIMRSTAAGTLDAWHLAQRFTAAPVLNQTFIEDTPPMARVLAAGALAAGQNFLVDFYIEREAVRPLPTFGTPAQLGRF